MAATTLTTEAVTSTLTTEAISSTLTTKAVSSTLTTVAVSSTVASKAVSTKAVTAKAVSSTVSTKAVIRRGHVLGVGAGYVAVRARRRHTIVRARFLGCLLLTCKTALLLLFDACLLALNTGLLVLLALDLLLATLHGLATALDLGGLEALIDLTPPALLVFFVGCVPAGEELGFKALALLLHSAVLVFGLDSVFVVSLRLLNVLCPAFVVESFVLLEPLLG